MHCLEKVTPQERKELCWSSLPAKSILIKSLKNHFMAPKHSESQHIVYFHKLCWKIFLNMSHWKLGSHLIETDCCLTLASNLGLIFSEGQATTLPKNTFSFISLHSLLCWVVWIQQSVDLGAISHLHIAKDCGSKFAWIVFLPEWIKEFARRRLSC